MYAFVCGSQTSGIVSKELSILFSKSESHYSGAPRRLVWRAVSPGNPSMSAHQSLRLEVCVVMPIFPASEYGLVKIPQRKRISVCVRERPDRGHQF